jgi:DNA-binding NarL/FixJ family response regulator
LASARLLLVDDDEMGRIGLQSIFEAHEFEVTAAASVTEALKLIVSTDFEVLLTDLHMPGPGDGLTVVSAMRHANPATVTIVLSANPDMERAAEAILHQADEVMLKPISAGSVVEAVRRRLSGEALPRRHQEAAATILERETQAITDAWIAQMEAGGSLGSVPLSLEERCAHLPDALRDIVFRLRYPQPLGSTTLFSMAALQHGARRRRQGIGAATLVEESRALQIALFQTIEKNLDRMQVGRLPATLMAIADEVNAQLFQSLTGYEREESVEGMWGGGFSG